MYTSAGLFKFESNSCLWGADTSVFNVHNPRLNLRLRLPVWHPPTQMALHPAIAPAAAALPVPSVKA